MLKVKVYLLSGNPCLFLERGMRNGKRKTQGCPVRLKLLNFRPTFFTLAYNINECLGHIEYPNLDGSLTF